MADLNDFSYPFRSRRRDRNNNFVDFILSRQSRDGKTVSQHGYAVILIRMRQRIVVDREYRHANLLTCFHFQNDLTAGDAGTDNHDPNLTGDRIAAPDTRQERTVAAGQTVKEPHS